MNASWSGSGLKAGEWVEVRTREEILATLDKQGRLESLPFMPEMFKYCGQRLRVGKSAHKTCDYLGDWQIRRMKDSVFLEGVRCDGQAHGGCQALCLIFWKEAWLRPATSTGVVSQTILRTATQPGARTEDDLDSACTYRDPAGMIRYACQTTETTKFSEPMKWWDLPQWIADVRSRNLDSGLAGDSARERRFEKLLAVLRVVYAIAVFVFNRRLAADHGYHPGIPQYPRIQGQAQNTPLVQLNIQECELVQVLSKEEIEATINIEQKNRGLLFDVEMLPYCGGIYRVLRRVTRIVEERSGKLIELKNPCLILEGVVCKGDFHRLCQRAIYAYWRENWVRRVTSEQRGSLPSQASVGMRE